jgi:hypothetical protein
MSEPKPRRFVRPANDNGPRPMFRAYVDLFIPASPLRIEVEVIAELLDSLPEAANDNEGDSP